MLEEFRLDNGYIWPMAVGPPDLVRLLNVNTQSTAIGIGTDGVVRFRKGYGTNSPHAWRGFLDQTAQ